jgi:predicted transcriptional regulator of viral defense system
MANVSKAVDSARKVFSKRGGMLRMGDALRLGIHPRTLYKLRDRGELERVGRGLYRLSTAPHLTNPGWVIVAIRAPNAVVCLISALAHHGMTTRVRWCRPTSSSESYIQTTFHGSRASAHWPFG